MPDLGIVLGSGLGALVEDISDARSVAFADIPGFAPSSVVGHSGRIVTGSLGGRRVIVFAGRIHAYEGHSLAAVAFPVRVMHAVGARVLFVSNAAGAIRRDFQPGDLMLIKDHMNLMFGSPLEGPLQDGDERFPDMSDAYDTVLRETLAKTGRAEGMTLRSGVYAALRGPNYETRAEVRMLERLGADAVGMSTIPEVIVARTLGMRVAGVSCISNLACGLAEAPLTHAEVIETTARIADRFRALVRGFAAAL